VTYIVTADLEARVSALVVRQILDDDQSGAADTTAVTRVIADAESYVEGFLRGNYDLAAVRALGTGAPNEVKRLCLDIAVAYLWERHPEYVRADGDKLFERARRDLVDLRAGKTRLDIVASVEPAANQGGVVESDNEDDRTVLPKLFNADMGIY